MNETKLDKILDNIVIIQVDVAEIRRDILHHIKRTDLAEENLKMLREDLRPVEQHVERVNGVF